MKCPTQIEQDLFDYLQPDKQIEVEEHFAALEADAPNECPNCHAVIADADSFCDDDCKDAWWGDEAIELMVRPDPVLDEDRLRDRAEDR